jgi:hypothetical protein
MNNRRVGGLPHLQLWTSERGLQKPIIFITRAQIAGKKAIQYKLAGKRNANFWKIPNKYINTF